MRRRDFVAGLVLATAPGRLRAQQAAKVYRIAYVDPSSPIALISGDWPTYRAFIDELRRLGYVEKRNLLVDKFSAERHANTDYDEVAREVVRRSPDLIVTITTPSSLALRKETRTIPIVFLTITDPVDSGLVSSMAKPGGNLTGFTDYEPSLGGKWVELLKEISPATTRMAMYFHEATAPFARKFIVSAEAAAARLSVPLTANNVPDLPELEQAVAAFAAEPNGGLVVVNDTFSAANYEGIIRLAYRHHLPAIYPWHFCPRHGGLISYNFDSLVLFL